jgi:hypothetical protein
MKKIIEKTIVISNIRYLYPELSTGNELRIAVGALSLTNQKSNVGNDCNPMISGWNENPAVEFADFQWWTKCQIEDSSFIIGETVLPFQEEILLHPETTTSEPSVVLEFKDGTRFRLVVRDKEKPIEVCVCGEEPNFIEKKIKEFGYTFFFD